MTNPNFQLSSHPKYGTAEWLAKHCRGLLEYLCWVLCSTNPERDAHWFDILEWECLEPNQAYRACCNLLGHGFDPKRWWEEQCGICEAKVLCPPQPKPRLTDEEIFQLVLRHIEINRIDITSDRKDWLAIGAALKCSFGCQGLDYWKRISKNYDGYSERECEIQWRSLARHGNYGLGVIYNVCRRFGISVKEIIKQQCYETTTTF